MGTVVHHHLDQKQYNSARGQRSSSTVNEAKVMEYRDSPDNSELLTMDKELVARGLGACELEGSVLTSRGGWDTCGTM